VAPAVKTKSNRGHKTMAFDRERVEGLCYSGSMEFYMEIAAHRVCGLKTLWGLGSYGVSNVWATGCQLQYHWRKPHTHIPSTPGRFSESSISLYIVKITTDNTAMKNARGKVIFCELRALFRIRNIDSFGSLPFLWWTQRREALFEVLSRIDCNSGWVNELKGRDKATWRC